MSTRGGPTVYPRPRGGAQAAAAIWTYGHGLSPPTRGSQDHRRRNLLKQRSIPAHAGEPTDGDTRGIRHGVYPRPRGGALLEVGKQRVSPGLSPPTRGSHGWRLRRHPAARSIPAHAGEPTSPTPPPWIRTVYPRPRGGACPYSGRAWNRCGLSPPTRGSHGSHHDQQSGRGSIPAHAGEPLGWDSHGRPLAVYPRPRGGASCFGRNKRV